MRVSILVNCTSAKVNCLYCPSVVRYDGIRAHVKNQHPLVELTRGFSRNLTKFCVLCFFSQDKFLVDIVKS